jgi:hypothetical protein
VSIYATLWHLQFPRHGDSYTGCEWIEVLAQGVRRVSGYGYESGDPFASFLPPALRIGDGVFEDDFRAVVFVTNLSKKGTSCAAIGPGWFWSWAGQHRRRRSSCGQDAEFALRAEIVFEIRFRVAKGNVMLLQHRMHLEPALEFQETPNLSLGQRTRPISFDGDRLERTLRYVIPAPL